MMEDLRPVFPGVPGDFARGVNLYGHDLADAGTLDNNHKCANATGRTTPFFASLDVTNDEGVANVCSGNDMCGGYRKSFLTGSVNHTMAYQRMIDVPTMGFRMAVMVAQFDEEGALTDVCRNAFQLKSLETCPTEESGVGGCKFSEVLGKIFVGIARPHGLLLHSRYLIRGVLADRFV
jgi:hypothetical protein